MNKKRFFSGVFISLIVLVISVTAFAALNETSARDIAEEWMPPESTYLQTKSDTDEFEIYFFNKLLNTDYKIEINKFSEKITKISSKLKNAHGSTIVLLDENQLEGILASEFPDASIQKIKLDHEDNYYIYEIKFINGSSEGEMEINPENGSILKWELEY